MSVVDSSHKYSFALATYADWYMEIPVLASPQLTTWITRSILSPLKKDPLPACRLNQSGQSSSRL